MKVGIRSILVAIGAGAPTGAVFFVLLPYVAVKLNRYSGMPVWDHGALKYPGFILVVGGVLLFLYCSGVFIRLGRGTPAPAEPPKKMVKNGIYQYTRNPMYLSYLSILMGIFLFFGHLFLLVYFLFMVVFINLYLRSWEEPILEKRFGSEYEDYKEKVPRWF